MPGYSHSAVTQTPIINVTNAVSFTAGSNLTYYNYQNAQTGDSTMIMGDDVIGVSIEEFCDKGGEFHEHKVCVRCPHCAYPNYPFRRKKKPKCLETGQEWVGIDHQQAYAHYETWCVYCDEAYYMRLFAPQ